MMWHVAITPTEDPAIDRSPDSKRPSEHPVFDLDAVAITIVYAAAWFLLPLNGGRHVDDWVDFRLSLPAAAVWAKEMGSLWQTYFTSALEQLPGNEFIGHALVFALYLACALLLNRILRRMPVLGRRAQVLIPMVFAVFPVNGARYALANIQYAISLSAFCLAWYLVAADLEEPRLWRIILSAAAFLFALLSTGSLMTLVAVVPIYVACVRTADLRSPATRRGMLRRYGYLIALPVVAWGVRSWALRPSGQYVGYNTVALSGALHGLSMFPMAVKTSLVDPIASSLAHDAPLVLLLAVPAYLLLRLLPDGEDPPVRRLLLMLGGGAIAFFLAVFPYLAVGKLPIGTGLDSRHQLLVPLGASLIVYAGAMLAGRALRLRTSVMPAVLALLLAAFIVSDLRISLSYQADWYKQVSLMQRMKASDDIRSGNYIVVRDRTLDLNIMRNGTRRYVSYELNGMMYSVFGDETRFGVDEATIDVFDPCLLREYARYEQYHAWQYEPPPRRRLVLLTAGATDVSRPGTMLGLLWRQCFAPSEFDRLVRDVVRIETTPLSAAGEAD